MLQYIKKHKKTLAKASIAMSTIMGIIFAVSAKVLAADGDNLISIGISSGDGSDMAGVLQMLIVLTVISLAPSILIMLTSFTRIVIVLHFTRAAIGTQTVPPNQVIIGLSLFLTVFVMTPTFTVVSPSLLDDFEEPHAARANVAIAARAVKPRIFFNFILKSPFRCYRMSGFLIFSVFIGQKNYMFTPFSPI